MPVDARELEVFEAARGRLEAIAYRLLGSANDAEDMVQETFLRWQAADREMIETPAAWLTKVPTNLCLNRLGSARARRETYVGQWLPEPVLAGDDMLGPSETAEQRESVTIAMLTLMERLAANERVVFVLREAFGYSHAEIAGLLDLSETNCQQIYRRAKQHLAAPDRRRAPVDAPAARKVVEEFLAATLSGRTDDLVRLLSDDAISFGDGGGVVFSLPEPVTGKVRVARFLRGLFTSGEARWEQIGGRPQLFAAVANGAPALVVTVGERLAGVITLDVTTDGIAAVHAMVNPAKLNRARQEWAATEHGEPLTVPW
ncbi:RNA polymerase sigma factor SigJ [Paractinoplanes abujensis]|uniref:RNA polymerase sigma-70 factor (ECF subfamily) n=1 Tax=Paractinoplanes abujensis TaxID=882441 RepID=A0A7W7CM76_9ACTN|nr:RNA polymerase sigma factor SigJ [Actinoplanes abujensis]MBB4691137.1 RNA polymerase sigma-70 factor (ECF subfamily) [Actinoplanes abujensis]